MLGRSGVAILLLCWCGSCQCARCGGAAANSWLSNKTENKSPEIDLVARCGGEAANSSSSEIENKGPTRSTLSFAPGK
jgi:hypothetical protein